MVQEWAYSYKWHPTTLWKKQIAFLKLMGCTLLWPDRGRVWVCEGNIENGFVEEEEWVLAMRKIEEAPVIRETKMKEVMLWERLSFMRSS